MYHSWIEVNLSQLQENIRAIRSAVTTDSEIVFVVKANAYGHGLIPIAEAAAKEKINWFAVAYLESALLLREKLPDANLLVIGYISPEKIDLLLEKNITPIITDREHGLAFSAAALKRGETLHAHLKVDTGMGRLGVQWDEVQQVADELAKAGGVCISGVCSHFSKVEPESPENALAQTEKFEMALMHVPADAFKHFSSSRAALYFPEWDYNGVRQGIDLYGYGASDPAGRFTTKPILQWKSRIAQVKEVPAGFSVGYYGTHVTTQPTRIATVEVGYADGYNRALSNRGDVLIGGQRCAIVGRVSMNWITVDLGLESDAKTSDEVVLIGEQGEASVWANELSKICRTIPYEILTSINTSLERKYLI